MSDRLTREQRSRVMSRVRNRNTKPERIVRSALHRLGYRFRLHVRSLPGCPDIAMPRHRTVVLVHGCFWHGHLGCPRAGRPSTNEAFWAEKIDRNVSRDGEVQRALLVLGWRVIVVWECETRNPEDLAELLVARLGAGPGKADP